jgi:type I restriction enzyme S subunit
MRYEYKNSGIGWLGEMPKHWKVDRIKDKTTAVVGGDWGNDPESEGEGKEIVVLRVSDLNESYFSFDNLTYRKIKTSSFQSRKITNHCVLIEKSGGGEKQLVGRVGYPKDINFEAICSNFMAKIEFNNSVEIHFCNYIFSSLYDLKLNFPYVQQTTGIQNLNVGYYLTTKVVFPPLQEQKAIADYLDKACTRIDKIIEIKEKQLERIKLHRKNRINEVVRFGLKKSQIQKTSLSYIPEINEKWSMDRFKDVASLRVEKTDEKSEKVDYLELEDLSQGTGKILKKNNTMEVASKVTKFYSGDVLYGKLRPYLEKYYYADFDGKCTGEILAFEPKKLEGKFLMYLIASNWFISLCNSMSYGAKMPRVNWNTQLSQIYLPLPLKKEQIEIISYLDKLSERTYETTKNIKSQIKTIKKYRKSLIYGCVTGKKQVFFENEKTEKAFAGE